MAATMTKPNDQSPASQPDDDSAELDTVKERLPRDADNRHHHDIVEAENVTVGFGGQTILKDISLIIPRGQTLAVIGESGCGKTVLMKTLIGLVTPDAGTIRFDGQDLAGLGYKAMTETRRRIGFVFQNAALFDSMNIYQNMAFPIRQHEMMDEEDIRDLVLELLTEVGLPKEVLRKRPSEISGGMRKRVGLARALILKPELVLYDEPTTGLDPIMSDVINELILSTRRKHPVTSVIVTHDMRTARKVADRVVMLFPRRRLARNDSQILFDGPPSQLENAEDRRVRQFVRGEAGERLQELQAEPDSDH